jgi:hypothetical protein
MWRKFKVSGQLHGPAALPPGKNSPEPIGGSVCPTTGLDDMEKRKFLSLPGLELQIKTKVANMYTLLNNCTTASVLLIFNK